MFNFKMKIKKNKVVPIHFEKPKTIFNDLECSICFENFHDKPKIFLPCGHSFHGDCILKWFNKDMSCAICRKRLSFKID